MFDIAWSEMVLIGAVALVVIGPKDLPKALRTVGQTVARVRRMASEFQGQFNEAMREAELSDLKKQVEDVGGSVSSALNSDFKPIDSLKDFETPKPDEAALKEAEAKLAALPQPEPLPPVQIETPKPADKPKRARKTAAEPAVEAPVAVVEPSPAKPARKRSAKAAEGPAAVEAPAPAPVATVPAKPPKAVAAARKPKLAAAPTEPAKPAARKRKTAKGEENSA
ncbi:sec-independent protein translocase protein TatB [Bosea sp. AK1]|uniref:Sec-independent protein translocase protein TatB n=1 Tax=Bosea sp. AK1 TaxID=2587160 RepID=UPI0011529E66|nr:Sec-independent protein translocase protein TatB [Bosea sp. AK1]TQI72516.1 sec-independent protein translocase protein TatB [Bosea sp. AK1]